MASGEALPGTQKRELRYRRGERRFVRKHQVRKLGVLRPTGQLDRCSEDDEKKFILMSWPRRKDEVPADRVQRLHRLEAQK